MKKILFHTCCSPCACYPVEELKKEGFDVTLFFYNPNIHPHGEYQARLKELKKYLGDFPEVELIEGDYQVEKWFELTRGLEKEPERGRRCDICYQLRLEQTARFAKNNGYQYFGSSLSISPHKKAEKISSIGAQLAEEFKINFYDRDWKKQDGFKRSCAISRQHGFYRQDYCGCIYSKRDSQARLSLHR